MVPDFLGEEGDEGMQEGEVVVEDVGEDGLGGAAGEGGYWV